MNFSNKSTTFQARILQDTT